MLLNALVGTSKQIAATSSRLAKINHISDLLKQLSVPEIDVAVSYLSGSARQSRVGVGYAALRNAGAKPTLSPSLEIADVDRSLAGLAALKGSGSAGKRQEQLQQLGVIEDGLRDSAIATLHGGN